jgi:uncharacterized protein YqhQ
VPESARLKQHFYGGQALIEGVMMRGKDHWAVAVRRPDGEIHTESHEIDSVMDRHPLLARPGFRGVIALGQALGIGYRALMISANQGTEEEIQVGGSMMAVSLGVALVFFLGIFVALPALFFGWAEKHFLGSGFAANLLEGISRVALFVGYLVLIGRMKEVKRVFAYHGAEHKTIAAYEHDAPLEPGSVDRFSTLHVRCGTNFLLIIMIVSVLVFSFFGSPGIVWRVMSRVIAIPLIAAAAYELLRLGARFEDSAPMRALMAPGLWLQKITTKAPDKSQIEVAIASFQEVLRREAGSGSASEAPEPPIGR